MIFPFWKWCWNRWFLLPMGLLYLVVFWALFADLEPMIAHHLSLGSVLGTVVFEKPRGILLLGVFILGCWFFADVRKKYLSQIIGILHGVAHFVAALCVTWLAMQIHARVTKWLASKIMADAPSGLANSEVAAWLASIIGIWMVEGSHFWFSTLAVFALGGLIASLIVGLYLFLSLNICWGILWNAAFGSLAIPDWKNFLRLKINETGLMVYPIGIHRVPRGRSGPGPIPASDLHPELIERPIQVTKPYKNHPSAGTDIEHP